MHAEGPGRDVAVRRRISVGDIVVSILLWCCMPALLLTAVLLDLSFLMFIDVCPPETCSVNGAISAVVVSGTCAFLIMLASIVWGIVRLVRRRLAWPRAGRSASGDRRSDARVRRRVRRPRLGATLGWVTAWGW